MRFEVYTLPRSSKIGDGGYVFFVLTNLVQPALPPTSSVGYVSQSLVKAIAKKLISCWPIEFTAKMFN